MIGDLNLLADRCHKANIKWWQDPKTQKPIERNKGELLMLVITELAETCEGERKNLMDDKLPHRKMAEVEMADALIRLLDFSAGFGITLYDVPVSNDMPANKAEVLFCLCKCVCASYVYRYKTVDVESICFAISGIIEYCKVHKYDLMGAFEDKMVYNATREDHKHEARLIAGGKQF